MNVLIILYFVISIALIFILVFTEIIPTYKVSLWTKEVILAVLLVGLAVIMLFIPTHIQKTEVVGNAVLIERFEDASLYLDEENDIYFAVETDRWNPFEMYTRVEIPRELAIQKINEANNAETTPKEGS